MTAEQLVVTARPSIRSQVFGRTQSPFDRISYLAMLLVTVGTGIPTVMMVNGALRLDITYHWWAWAGLPAAWIPAVIGALALRVALGPASLLLFLATAFGTAFFWPEYGLFTFGPVCLLAGAIYVREMRKVLLTR